MYKVKVNIKYNERFIREKLRLTRDEVQELIVSIWLDIKGVSEMSSDLEDGSVEYARYEKRIKDLAGLIPGAKVEIFKLEIEHPRVEEINKQERKTGYYPEYEFLRNAWRNTGDANIIVRRLHDRIYKDRRERDIKEVTRI